VKRKNNYKVPLDSQIGLCKNIAFFWLVHDPLICPKTNKEKNHMEMELSSESFGVDDAGSRK
jgi:hypothetical protein